MASEYEHALDVRDRRPAPRHRRSRAPRHHPRPGLARRRPPTPHRRRHRPHRSRDHRQGRPARRLRRRHLRSPRPRLPTRPAPQPHPTRGRASQTYRPGWPPRHRQVRPQATPTRVGRDTSTPATPRWPIASPPSPTKPNGRPAPWLRQIGHGDARTEAIRQTVTYRAVYDHTGDDAIGPEPERSGRQHDAWTAVQRAVDASHHQTQPMTPHGAPNAVRLLAQLERDTDQHRRRPQRTHPYRTSSHHLNGQHHSGGRSPTAP